MSETEGRGTATPAAVDEHLLRSIKNSVQRDTAKQYPIGRFFLL